MARTETTLITTGDYDQRLGLLLQRIDELDKGDDDAPESGARRVGEGGELAEVRKQFDDLRAAAERDGVTVTQRGLFDDEWDEFCDKHPAREGNDGDQAMGFGDSAAARRQLVYMSLVEPSFPSMSAFEGWLREKGLTRGDMSLLSGKAWRLTNGVYEAPKSLNG